MARPKKDESLHRGKRVYIRFTELEYELVAGYAKDAGYPIGTFVRKQALREKLEVNYNIVADLGEIQNLTVQAAGIGNNLNQIARFFSRRRSGITRNVRRTKKVHCGNP